MNKFDQYLQHILQPNHKSQDIEHHIIQIYKKQLYKQNASYTIEDAFRDTHEEVIKQKMIIIFLQFSHNNTLFISKDKIKNIPYFACVFESIDTHEIHEGCIIELKLNGIIDDYKCMHCIIDFVHYGTWINLNEHFLNLVIINNFLLDAKYITNWNIMPTEMSEHLQGIFIKWDTFACTLFCEITECTCKCFQYNFMIFYILHNITEKIYTFLMMSYVIF